MSQTSPETETLKAALDNSQSLLVMLLTLGDDEDGTGIMPAVWQNEGLSKLLTEQVVENRAALTAGHAQTGQQPDTRALLQFVGWVDSWVSNPVGAYSVNALEGLFGLTRDKIVALTNTSTTREGNDV